MEGAVRGHRAQHFADRLDAAFACGFGALHHQGRGAHAHDHAVPAAVERKAASSTTSSVAAAPAGQEAGAEPFDQVVGSDVVRRDDDHAAAAAGADPVLRQRNGLGGAGAGGVDLRVRTAGADELGELRMPHGQDAEQEAPVERRTAPSRWPRATPPCAGRVPVPSLEWPFVSATRLRRSSSIANCSRRRAVGVVARHLVGERVEAGEHGGEDHAGVVAQGVGQSPAVRQLRAFAGGLVAHAPAECRHRASASMPAPMARRVTRSSAAMRSAETPNSFPGRKRRRGPPA